MVAPLLIGGGCSSEPPLHTRTYTLPKGDMSWEAISLVLNEQWQEHAPVGQQGHREGDTAVVRTTAEGHRKIQEALLPR
jgi:hypothetical protein